VRDAPHGVAQKPARFVAKMGERGWPRAALQLRGVMNPLARERGLARLAREKAESWARLMLMPPRHTETKA